MASGERVEIECEVVEQGKTYITIRDGSEYTSPMNGKRYTNHFTLPKSEVEFIKDGVISIPEWLAIERGLA